MTGARGFTERARALLRERLQEIAREIRSLTRERGELRSLLKSIGPEGRTSAPRPRRRARRLVGSPGGPRPPGWASPLRNGELETPGPGRARPSPPGGRGKAGASLVGEAEAPGPRKIGGGALEAVLNLARCYAGPLGAEFIARTLAERDESRMTAAEVDRLLAEHGFKQGVNGKWNLKREAA